MSTVYVVGLGPGAGEQMTVRAEKIAPIIYLNFKWFNP